VSGSAFSVGFSEQSSELGINKFQLFMVFWHKARQHLQEIKTFGDVVALALSNDTFSEFCNRLRVATIDAVLSQVFNGSDTASK